jgi:hypothetical protein
LQEGIDVLEKLKAGCCNVNETFDIMTVDVEERIRELQDLFLEVMIRTSIAGCGYFLRFYKFSGHRHEIFWTKMPSKIYMVERLFCM